MHTMEDLSPPILSPPLLHAIDLQCGAIDTDDGIHVLPFPSARGIICTINRVVSKAVRERERERKGASNKARSGDRVWWAASRSALTVVVWIPVRRYRDVHPHPSPLRDRTGHCRGARPRSVWATLQGRGVPDPPPPPRPWANPKAARLTLVFQTHGSARDRSPTYLKGFLWSARRLRISSTTAAVHSSTIACLNIVSGFNTLSQTCEVWIQL
jgi:hypothetical protein